MPPGLPLYFVPWCWSAQFVQADEHCRGFAHEPWGAIADGTNSLHQDSYSQTAGSGLDCVTADFDAVSLQTGAAEVHLAEAGGDDTGGVHDMHGVRAGGLVHPGKHLTTEQAVGCVQMLGHHQVVVDWLVLHVSRRCRTPSLP